MPDYPRIAYEAWAQHQDWKDGDFDDIPRWDRLPQDLKDAWDAAIDQVAIGLSKPRTKGAKVPKKASKASY